VGAGFDLHKKQTGFRRLKTCGHFRNPRPLQKPTATCPKWVQVFNLHMKQTGFRRLKTCGHFRNLRPLQKPTATSETCGHLSEVGAGF